MVEYGSLNSTTLPLDIRAFPPGIPQALHSLVFSSFLRKSAVSPGDLHTISVLF
jgi:hypothetical protein